MKILTPFNQLLNDIADLMTICATEHPETAEELQRLDNIIRPLATVSDMKLDTSILDNLKTNKGN